MGWSIVDHLGPSEEGERILLRDEQGRLRSGVLHTNLGLLTHDPLRHPAER
ncbi:hypothetical protein [uncultured Limimaricola sp.]|uniref:hypothetical protein n=1 Tax=uncultured Limimaricola sp. TaxID=2211667 RepID=UPI0030FA8FE7